MNAAPPKRRRSSWFAFYPDDFTGGTRGMTLAARGAFVELLGYQFANGSIPPDDRTLCRIVGAFPDEWEAIRAEVLAKFKTAPDGSLFNERMEKEREERNRIRETRIEAIGKRWKNQDTNGHTNGNTKPIQNEYKCNDFESGFVDTSSSSSSSSSTTKTTKKPPKSPKGDFPTPESFPQPLRECLSDWQRHRREIKKPITPTAWDGLIQKCERDPVAMLAQMRRSIVSGWQGLIPDQTTEEDVSDAYRSIYPPKPSQPAEDEDLWEKVKAKRAAEQAAEDARCTPVESAVGDPAEIF